MLVQCGNLDEAQQANAIVYCLKGKAKQVFKEMDAGKQKDINEEC